MKKDVLVQVRGTQTTRFGQNDSQETMESVTAGLYYERNGCCYLFYEECLGDLGDVVKNRMEIRPESVKITKTGSIRACMNFELGKKNITFYQTAYGQIEVAFLTDIIQIETAEDFFRLYLRYELEMNRQYSSDNQIEITVTPNLYGE